MFFAGQYSQLSLLSVLSRLLFDQKTIIPCLLPRQDQSKTKRGIRKETGRSIEKGAGEMFTERFFSLLFGRGGL